MTDWLTNSNASASRDASILAEFAASSRVASHQIAEIIGIARRNRLADDRNAGPGNSWVWSASQLGVTKKAAHERYGKISPRAWASRFQHTDEDCRLELSAI
jgi:hypothetical protein